MDKPKKTALGRKLTKAREKRGWSIHAACSQTESVKYESLSRLESGRTIGDRVPVATVMQLVDLYWPEVNIKDFVSNKRMKKYALGWEG